MAGAAEKRKSIIVASRSDRLRDGLVALLGMNSQLAVIGQCSDGSTALEMVLSSRPHVALIDSDLPGMDSIDLIRRLRASDVPIRLLLLVNRGEDDAVSEALSAGVDGYVLKSSPARQLLDALLPKPAERVQLRQMSRRELEILRMVRGEHSEVTSRFKSAPTIEDGCWECGEPFGAGEEPVEVELSESEWEMMQFPLPQFPQRGNAPKPPSVFMHRRCAKKRSGTPQ